MLFKILGILVLTLGFYCLALVVFPTGYSSSPMNFVCGLLFSVLGVLLILKPPNRHS